ncbi:multidrug efflux SMR transporter [Paenibacillus doosanensis]|uniref:Multidrug resistance protein YkkD n=1 Tax=Paenibacillus konkukensis TaxID=2020716 RepID=A0ABY4S0E7_9BACL|nr:MULTISPECIES: multidrug efflux SMR transporter [Paenibacillus]MCS7458523.1 multidrug efflux SMR transporter [Paenibacillus doosanensis]UQZ86954.1 Multidrug resistance protein YkkD [Paenibacillus konkukensis]
MSWIFLLCAGACEVVGFVCLQQVNRSANVKTVAQLLVCFVFSFFFLSRSLGSIPIGTAYAVWTGIGTVGSTLLGMYLYGESKNGKRIFFIACVIAAVVGLKLIS